MSDNNALSGDDRFEVRKYHNDEECKDREFKDIAMNPNVAGAIKNQQRIKFSDGVPKKNDADVRTNKIVTISY